MSKKILCVDFDGVLHAYTSGWHGAEIISDGPVPGATLFLRDAVDFFDVRVFSSRSYQPGGIEAMSAALFEWLADDLGARGVEVHAQISFPTEKPVAFMTIDDRAYCFEGAFPDPMKLLDFEPWNRRS